MAFSQQKSKLYPSHFLSSESYLLMKNPVKIIDVANKRDIILDASEVNDNYKKLGFPIVPLPDLKKEIETWLSKNTNSTRKSVVYKTNEDVKKQTADVIVPVYIFGSPASGKSAIIARLVDDKFITSHGIQLETNFATHNMDIDNCVVEFNVKELPSQPKMLQNVWSNIRGGSSFTTVMIVVDITDRNSLDQANELVTKAKEKFSHAQFVLISTKNDLEHNRQITKEELDEFAVTKQIDVHFETSAKENNMSFHVSYPFVFSAKKAISEKYIGLQFNSFIEKLSLEIQQIKDKMTLASLLAFTQGINDPAVFYLAFLDKLESLFRDLVNATNNQPSMTFFGSRNNQYTDAQLADISVLKKMFILCIENQLFNKLPDQTKQIIEKLAENSELIDFNSTRYDLFYHEKTDSRIKIDKILKIDCVFRLKSNDDFGASRTLISDPC